MDPELQGTRFSVHRKKKFAHVSQAFENICLTNESNKAHGKFFSITWRASARATPAEGVTARMGIPGRWRDALSTDAPDADMTTNALAPRSRERSCSMCKEGASNPHMIRSNKSQPTAGRTF